METIENDSKITKKTMESIKLSKLQLPFRNVILK